MSVKIRQRVYRKTNTVTWQADIHVKLLDGRKIRERSKIPGATSRSAALKWARERERWLILHGHEEGGDSKEGGESGPEATEVPTLATFSERFMAEYVHANRLKPSTIYNKRKIINTYLLPNLGDQRLDAITEADVARMKARYAYQAPASVNNILTLLGTMLKTAIEWGVIETMPRIRKLKQPRQSFDFYDEPTFERLVEAAAKADERCLVAVLLGGDAGLRGGEITALRLCNCDVDRGVINVCENVWRGHVHLPKGNRARQVVMTARLRALLRRLRDERGDLEQTAILRSDGEAPTKRVIDRLVWKAQKAAGLAPKGPHILRHTFCSRLAARGAPPRAIQELAGHVHSSTTDRYMHLAPSALRTAISLIEGEAATGTSASRATAL